VGRLIHSQIRDVITFSWSLRLLVIPGFALAVTGLVVWHAIQSWRGSGARRGAVLPPDLATDRLRILSMAGSHRPGNRCRISSPSSPGWTAKWGRAPRTASHFKSGWNRPHLTPFV